MINKVNTVNKVFRRIATILWVLGGIFLAWIALAWWSSGFPDDWSYEWWTFIVETLLIAPAVIIYLTLWINISRDPKEARRILHEAPSLIYEHHSQE